jgi:23S rRNA pseudouridine1911/1915/1917 synthase
MPRSPYQLPDEIIFPDDQEDMRLDVAVKQMFTGLSLREIRRILSNHHLRLNGQRAMKGTLVKPGDCLKLIDLSPDASLRKTLAAKDAPGASGSIGQISDPAAPTCAHSSHAHIKDNTAPQWGKGPGKVRIIKKSNRFVALFKPAGLHSVELKNRGGDSLEELLDETWKKHFNSPPILLNRLDLLTSGIILAALSADHIREYQDWEAAQRIEKTYFALVYGVVEGEMRLTRCLDMDSRLKTRVLDHDDPDSSRHTLAHPLAVFSGAKAARLAAKLDISPPPDARTLLKISIRRGARHQIRAHLAAAGYPIVGDHLYGRSPGLVMYLHHAAITLPDFTAQCPPPWPRILLEYLTPAHRPAV